MMTGKIVMVTGANSGIGRVTARELALQGATVIMVCRNEEKGKAVQEDINADIGIERAHLLLADFSDRLSIRKMTDEFKSKFERLDVLINNAGLMMNEKKMTKDGIEYTMAVNHFGYFLNTHFLLDIIQKTKNSRIVNVASMAHRMASLEWDNMNGEKSFQYFRQYCLTKLCNILFTNHLAEILKDSGTTANSLHPGMVRSNFGSSSYPFVVKSLGGLIMISPEKGAQTSIYLATSDEVKNITGAYFADSKRKFPSSLASNPKLAQKLWDWSLLHTGIETFGKTV